jgi:hypothetical protein
MGRQGLGGASLLGWPAFPLLSRRTILLRPLAMSSFPITWSENIPCGFKASHEVVFSFPPWQAVDVVFNPCDKLPVVIRAHREKACDSDELRRHRELPIQEIWFGCGNEFQATQLTEAIHSAVAKLRRRQSEIASAIMVDARAPDFGCALQSSQPHVAWAGMVLARKAMHLAQSHLQAVVTRSEHPSPMFRVHAIQLLLDFGRQQFTDDLIRGLESCPIHPRLRVAFSEKLADMGTPEVMEWLSRCIHCRYQRSIFHSSSFLAAVPYWPS